MHILQAELLKTQLLTPMTTIFDYIYSFGHFFQYLEVLMINQLPISYLKQVSLQQAFFQQLWDSADADVVSIQNLQLFARMEY